MPSFTLHTPASAPFARTLAAATVRLGFTPSHQGGLAESRTALKVYLEAADSLGNRALGAIEQRAVFLAASVENRCEFRRAAG